MQRDYAADTVIADVAHATIVQSEIPHGRVTARVPRASAGQSVVGTRRAHRADPAELPAAARPAARADLRPAAGTPAPAVGSHRPARRSAHGRGRRRHAGERHVRGVALRAGLRDVARAALRAGGAGATGRARREGRPDPPRQLPAGPLRQTRRGEAAGPPGRPRRTTAVQQGFPPATPRRSTRTIRSSCRRRSRTGTATSSPCTTAPGGSPASAPRSRPTSGIPEENVRILAPLVGGAFGSKSFLWMHVALCAVAAREVRRPVKLVLTRDQMFSSTGHRPRTEQHLSLVADGDARIISTEQHTLTETSTVAHFCEPVGLSARFLYESPRLVTSHTVARINAPTPCFMRGPGEAPGLFALEVAMDELAYAADVDPLELRLRNDTDVDQASGRAVVGQAPAGVLSAGCRAVRLARATDGAALADPRRRPGRVGHGHRHLSGPPDARGLPGHHGRQRVGRIRLCHPRSRQRRAHRDDSGGRRSGGPRRWSRSTFDSGDSLFPDAPYSGASQTTATVGSAVHQAATEWRSRFLDLLVDQPESPFAGMDSAALTVATAASQLPTGPWCRSPTACGPCRSTP